MWWVIGGIVVFLLVYRMRVVLRMMHHLKCLSNQADEWNEGGIYTYSVQLSTQQHTLARFEAEQKEGYKIGVYMVLRHIEYLESKIKGDE